MPTSSEKLDLVRSLVLDVPDYPKPGVMFKDITPLLGSPEGYRASVELLVEQAPPGIDVVVGTEARGFFFAGPVALGLGAGLVPVRKPGKLPRATYTEEFDLEYGTDTLSVHCDAIRQGARVMIIDDVLATGGTLGATARLVAHLGAELVHVAVLMELGFLDGRKRLADAGVSSVGALITV